MKKNYLIGCGLQTFIIIASVLLFPITVSAQPAYSRGEQRLPVSYEVAMQRSKAALIAEGYVNIKEGGAVISGFKENNTAVIMCNVAPDATTWINIVVATITNDAGIPDAERVKLQGRINQSGGSSTAAAKWRMTISIPPGQPYTGTYTIDIDLTEQNGNLTGSGTWTNGPAGNFTGTVKNNEVVLYRVDNSGFRSTFWGKGTANGRMEGTGQNDPASPGGNSATFSWTATRQ